MEVGHVPTFPSIAKRAGLLWVVAIGAAAACSDHSGPVSPPTAFAPKDLLEGVTSEVAVTIHNGLFDASALRGREATGTDELSEVQAQVYAELFIRQFGPNLLDYLQWSVGVLISRSERLV